jgi:hypothetical protein
MVTALEKLCQVTSGKNLASYMTELEKAKAGTLKASKCQSAIFLASRL